ncbi:hypothetical protein ACJJTC_014318 [Scirpophaga incertulas]
MASGLIQFAFVLASGIINIMPNEDKPGDLYSSFTPVVPSWQYSSHYNGGAPERIVGINLKRDSSKPETNNSTILAGIDTHATAGSTPNLRALARPSAHPPPYYCQPGKRLPQSGPCGIEPPLYPAPRDLFFPWRPLIFYHIGGAFFLERGGGGGYFGVVVFASSCLAIPCRLRWPHFTTVDQTSSVLNEGGGSERGSFAVGLSAADFV